MRYPVVAPIHSLAACLVVSLAGSHVALADAPSPSTAAFEEGMELLAKQQYGAALAAFRRSYALEATPVSAFRVGECELGLGHYDAAEVDFRAIASATLPLDSPPTFEEAQLAAKRQLVALSRLGSLHVVLIPEANAELRIDGDVVPLDATHRVRPGRHTVDVFAPSRSVESVVVDVASGEHKTATILLHASPPLPQRSGGLQNPALFAFGLGLTVLGGVAFLGGIGWLWFWGSRGISSASLGAVVLGGVGVGAGVPMVVVGGRQARDPSPDAFAPPPRVPTATFEF